VLQIEIKNKIKKLLRFKKYPEIYKQWITCEDVLVSSVFGIASYLPFECFMGPILKAAYPLCGSERFNDDLIENDVIKVEIWPEKGLHENKEYDGLWEFRDRVVILEAKKPQNILTQEQIINYLKIKQKLIKKTKQSIWLLAVAQGSANNICSIKLLNNCNLLYIDWTTIHNIVKKQCNSIGNNNIKRALDDLNSLLCKRNLRAFEGFHSPANILPLVDFKQFVEVSSKWFPYQPTIWPNLCQKSIVEFNFIMRNSTPLLFL
jgi:hypothetical protein